MARSSRDGRLHRPAVEGVAATADDGDRVIGQAETVRDLGGRPVFSHLASHGISTPVPFAGVLLDSCTRLLLFVTSLTQETNT